MRYPKNIFLVLSSGGMMLSCLCTCFAFILACLSHLPVSVSEAAGVLVPATLISYCHHQRGWRRINIFGIHVAGLLISNLWLCHRYYGIDVHFWRFGWVREFLLLERSAAGWVVLILILLCACSLWFFGSRLGIKPTDKTTISHRFDIGLACFLVLLLIKLLIAVKGGVVPVTHSSTRAIMAFIVLGLFSMGFVRTPGGSQTASASYLKGAGIVISFTAITFMLAGGLFLLFLPELQALAETGAGLLKALRKPIEQMVIALSRFSLKSGVPRLFGSEPAGGMLPGASEPPGDLGIIHYLFIGFTISILLTMAGFVLYHLLKWLLFKMKWVFAETESEKVEKGVWELLLLCVRAAKRVLVMLRARFFHPPDSLCAEKKYYRRLLRWGRSSGLRRAISETPHEYGIRLGERFPQVQQEIRRIIHTHAEAIYGCVNPDSHQISRARRALRRIQNPSLWFARIKSLCFYDRS